MKSEKRILIGKIATAHGIKGLVKVLVYAEDPALLSGILYTAETGTKTITLTMKNSMGKYWLAALENISDRTAAEKLRGTELWIERTALPESAENEIYHDDLIGLKIIDKDGTVLGALIAIENFGASDLLEINPPTGQSFYLPFVDQYVLETDRESQTMTVEIPEGLL